MILEETLTENSRGLPLGALGLRLLTSATRKPAAAMLGGGLQKMKIRRENKSG